MNLNKKDRLILSNQYRILEALYPDEAKDFQIARTAVEKGFEIAYAFNAEHIDDEVLNQDECNFVLEVLAMHRAMNFALKNIKQENPDYAEITDENIHFEGFDGNNETKHMSFTQYFIHDLDRFRELTNGNEYADFNSHSPKVEVYERQIEVWKALPNKYELTAENLITLIEARRFNG